MIVGNIGTGDAAKALAKIGVNAVKVGIGPGSICTTRIIAGIGIPQLSAIYEVSKALKGTNIPAIADGGIRGPDDMCKAIAYGADVVMLGSTIATTTESPAETIEKDNKLLAVCTKATGGSHSCQMVGHLLLLKACEFDQALLSGWVSQ